LLHYVLRPPVAQERAEQRPDGLVRITLKKAYTDGTRAVDMDPLSLLCRLATTVPPPRFHTVQYAGVLAPASPWGSRLAPPLPEAADAGDKPGRPAHAGAYRPWAELLARTFAVDVKNPAIISRTLATVGEATAATVARSRSALLEEPRAAPTSARRRGRGRRAWPQGSEEVA
jgi:Putative transposase